MTSKEAIVFYENEAKKAEIRSGCARSKSEEKFHKAKAKKFRGMAATIKKLFCRSYHTAAVNFDEDNK